MMPTQAIVRAAHQTVTVLDTTGRRLILRRLTALDTLRLFKAAGPVLAQNEPWLSMAGLAFAVLEIDGVPVPTPASEQQIETLIERLGDQGLTAIADAIKEETPAEDLPANVGNSLGTPS